jgi:hypothetical protein
MARETEVEMNCKRIVFSAVLAFCVMSPALAQEGERNDITPGELILERPTLICLGFDWRYTGDANNNASVTVDYRQSGEEQWRPALPLVRSGGSKEHYGSVYGFKNKKLPKPEYLSPQSFMGSILDLTPDTEYEVRLTMTDPEGISTNESAPSETPGVRMVTLRTRPEPMPFAEGDVRHVYPPGYKGEAEEPRYGSIMHAVNGHQPSCDCFQTIHPGAAPPGTVIKVHAGEYKADPANYRHRLGLWQHGTHVLVADGEPGKPIAIVAAGDGEVIFDGGGADTLFHIATADYLYFEGLTICNTRVAMYGGFQGTQGCTGLTVKNCRFENIDYGVLAQDGRSEDFYIADSVFLGGEIGPNAEYGAYAVNLSGQGHVVCYNYTENFWDHINVFTSALADPTLGQQARAIDFYNNEMRLAHDNFIEADGGYGNIRVLRNRMFHTRKSGWAWPLSLQHVYVGPAYFVRNIVYNTAKGQMTYKNLSGSRLRSYHNTSTSSAGGMHQPGDMRNNAFAPIHKLPNGMTVDDFRKGRPRTLALSPSRGGMIHDYNAYLRGQMGFPSYVFSQRRNEEKEFETLAEFAAASGFETHGVEYTSLEEAFVHVEAPDYCYRADDAPLVANDSQDFTPTEGSPLIDAGVVIPNINDDYTGAAPDLGAIEKGKPAPHFGPRTQSVERDTKE